MSPFNLNDQLKKLQQRKDLLIIFLLFFVISIFWIAIDVLSYTAVYTSSFLFLSAAPSGFSLFISPVFSS